MKGTTDSTQSTADEAASSGSSLRFTIRFESNMTHFAEAAMASDRARFEVLESASATVLEQVLLHLGFAVPEGSQPFRCATIAGTLERRRRGAQTEYDAESRLRKAAGKMAAGSQAKTAAGSNETSTEIELYDEKFARAQQVAADKAAALQLPDFPKFAPQSWFAQWVYDNVDADDLVEISTVLGTNTARTYRQLSGAMTIFYGLPRFAARVRAGEFTQAHVDVVTQLCATVNFEFLPKLDEFLATKRADITCETLRRSLAKMISLLVPPVAMTEIAAKRRRVDVESFKDGSACLTVNGPSAEIFACFNRIQGMALAIHGKNKSALNLPVGVAVSDERSIDQLQYDLFIRPVPELKVKIVSIDPVTGIQTAKEESLLDADGDLVPGVDTDEGLAAFAKTVDAKPADADDESSSEASGSAFGAADCSEDGGELGPAEHWVTVRMPTTQWWLSNQAATVATVPFLSLTGDSDLPGTFSDGSPMPAEVARTIAGHSKTIQRILTDPATGTPIDAKATSYQIPNALRRTLVEQWTVCSAPGCQRRAEKSEIDHVVPFFHLDPIKGGLTRFGNLVPLCKRHHALKTAGRYDLSMPESGEVDFKFRHGISAKVTAPEQPINIAQALEFEALAQLHLKRWSLPKTMVPPAPQVLELMPGESTIRARDEAKRLQEEHEAEQSRLTKAFKEHEAEQRRLMKAFKAQRLERARLRLERCLDWDNSVFQLCLPAGTDPAAMKQLTGNPRYAKVVKWARLAKVDIDSIDFDPNRPNEFRRRSTAESGTRSTAGSSAEPSTDAAQTTDAGQPTGAEPSTDTAQTTDAEQPSNNAQAEDTANSEASGAVDPWDHRFVSKKVNWDHDLEVDPPPF